jgi:signal transduction histidine kinase/CheY-like chemotaxis protein
VTGAPLILSIALGAAALLAGGWWIRRRRRDDQRRSMRAFHSLSENIIASNSPAEIVEQLAAVLPTITQATSVRLFLLNRRTKSLEAVPTAGHPEPMAISVETPQEGLASGAVACFRNLTLLNIPDVRRSALVNAGWKPGVPRSMMFVPLLAHRDVLGVLEIGNIRRLGYFTPEEQAAIHHLANQAAAAVKLQERHTVREQLLRSEKLAATGQLISGVASELRAPLESILQLSASLAAERDAPAIQHELKQLATESQRASEIVSRLVSFGRPDDSSARRVDVNAILAGLLEFRGPEWKALELRVQNRLSPEPAMVLGVQGQIEQVFLNLLLFVEQSIAAAEVKSLSVASSRMSGRAVVEIAYSTGAHPGPAPETGLDVWTGIVESHGGEMRHRSSVGASHFEVILPLAPGSAPSVAHASRPAPIRVLTVMLVDPDVVAQRQLMKLLAARGHRVVPVAAEEAADLAQRLRFDAIFFALRHGGRKWRDAHEHLSALIPSFILLSDSYDADFAAALQESGGFLLARPIQESELDGVLEAVEARAVARLS